MPLRFCWQHLPWLSTMRPFGSRQARAKFHRFPYVYANDLFAVDTRYNFDQPKTFTFFVGKAFGEKFVITPYLGFMAGDFKGSSVQINLFRANGRLSLFSLNQYAWMNGSPDFAYHWADVLVRVNGILGLGFDEQVYKEPRSDYFVDFGPVVKLFVGNRTYIKVWGTVDPWHNWDRKLFVGVGWTP